MEFNYFFTYTTWSFYATIAFLILAIMGFIFKWGVRFRFVGITSFMSVLTIGLFALSLGLFDRVEIEGATRYNLVYDTGGNQAVIAVSTDITPTELEATLQQASIDLYSYGRTASDSQDLFTVRARVQVHQDNFTYPIYLGEIKHSLAEREDGQAEVLINKKQFARLHSLLKG